MTLDLAHLRQLAEASLAANTWKAEPTGDDLDHAHDAHHRYHAALEDERVLLALLDRLQAAEDRLANARAHWRITAGSTYEMSGMGRILGEESTVYPTVMTQVGRKP